jgi:hypothetical protein
MLLLTGSCDSIKHNSHEAVQITAYLHNIKCRATYGYSHSRVPDDCADGTIRFINPSDVLKE